MPNRVRNLLNSHSFATTAFPVIVNVPIQRFLQYILAIETQYALREYAERGPLPAIPGMTFHHAPEAGLELSVVMPMWNPQKRQLERALGSLASHDFGDINYEIVICDDASKDDTGEKLVRSFNVPKLRYLRHPANIGGIANFNFSYAEGKGAWLHMLHQDDWIEPGFYQALLRGPAAQTQTALRYCRTRLHDETSGQTRLMFDEMPSAGVFTNFMDRQTVSQRIQFAGTIVSRAALEKVGGFDPQIGAAGDWEFWARIGSQFSVFYHPAQLATYTLHEGSWSNNAAAGFADVKAFERYRIVLHRMLAYSAPAKRSAAAAGFLQNMLSRLLDKALANRQHGKSVASIPLGHALLLGCKEAGILPDVEKVIFGVGQSVSPLTTLAPAKA